jgi:hypothetical protein
MLASAFFVMHQLQGVKCVHLRLELTLHVQLPGLLLFGGELECLVHAEHSVWLLVL